MQESSRDQGAQSSSIQTGHPQVVSADIQIGGYSCN